MWVSIHVWKNKFREGGIAFIKALDNKMIAVNPKVDTSTEEGRAFLAGWNWAKSEAEKANVDIRGQA